MTESKSAGDARFGDPTRDALEGSGPEDEIVAELGPMRELVEDLAALPSEARLPRDLWPGIRTRIAGAAAPKVVPLERAVPSSGRRFTFSLPQLVAAGIALAFISGGTVWLALSTQPVGSSTAVTPVLRAPAAVAVSDDGGIPATTVQDYENAVAELEMILEEGRLVLGHETIERIEESLAVIDDAIDEAREALDADPASDVLNRLLTRNMWKKMEILRQTAVAIRARST
jgi:hypothetical protein